MVTHIRSVAFQGVEVTPVDVQVQLAPGIPSFTLVGLPDKAVAESRDRVRAALGSLGLALPTKRILVNLAPADLAKEGSHFDLPIAIGLLAASMIASVAGKLTDGKLSPQRPYRDPHHSSSMAAMVGGGRRAVAGRNLARA